MKIEEVDEGKKLEITTTGQKEELERFVQVKILKIQPTVQFTTKAHLRVDSLDIVCRRWRALLASARRAWNVFPASWRRSATSRNKETPSETTPSRLSLQQTQHAKKSLAMWS